MATQGPDGMKLFVDGASVGTHPQTGAEGYTGYWRFGGDNLNAWPDRPSSDNFTGLIDEGAIYGRVLTDAEGPPALPGGHRHRPGQPAAGGLVHRHLHRLGCSFDASASSDPDGSVDGYAWDFGDGQTGTGETATHTYPAAGDYPVTLTVTDDDNATDDSGDVVVPRPAANAPAIIANDTFGRTLSNALGTAQTGGPWTLVGGNGLFAVDGKRRQAVAPGDRAQPARLPRRRVQHHVRPVVLHRERQGRHRQRHLPVRLRPPRRRRRRVQGRGAAASVGRRARR